METMSGKTPRPLPPRIATAQKAAAPAARVSTPKQQRIARQQAQEAVNKGVPAGQRPWAVARAERKASRGYLQRIHGQVTDAAG
jgi:hypothetical protein